MATLIDNNSPSDVAAIQVTARRADGWRTTCTLAAGNTLLVGASVACGLTLEGAAISPMHCLLTFHGGQLVVQGWSSADDTLVNGQLLSGEAVLNCKDEVAVGDYILEFAPPNLPPGRDDDDDDSSSSLSLASDELPPHALDVACDEPEESNLGQERELPDFEHEVSTEDETTELLRAEIRQLQCELAERDAQLYELLDAPNDVGFPVSAEPVESSDTSSLVNRLDELLDELARSDERAALLEELLRASEEATAAEHEERHQLDSWVSDIERRISVRESEWQAELELHRKHATQAIQERDEIERRLRKTASASDAKLEHDRILEGLREQNADLQERLRQAESSRALLEEKLQSVEVQNTLEAQQTEVDEAIREERVQLSQERAALARMRAELTNKLFEIEQNAKATNSHSNGGDDRIAALRDHLKEVERIEKAERGERGLMSRIAGLWKSLDG